MTLTCRRLSNSEGWRNYPAGGANVQQHQGQAARGLAWSGPNGIEAGGIISAKFTPADSAPYAGVVSPAFRSCRWQRCTLVWHAVRKHVI